MASFSDMLHSFLNPEKGYKDASDIVNNQWNETKGYLDPTRQAGQDQLGRLTGYEDALSHPEQLENQWASSYEMSPYAKQLLDQSKTSGLDAASSMGLSGSSAALGNIQKSAGNIMQSDRQSYLDDLMKKYMGAIGIGQDIYGKGTQAASQEATLSADKGNSLAQLKYGEDSAPGDMFGKLLGGGVDLAANLFTGGGAGAAKTAGKAAGAFPWTA